MTSSVVKSVTGRVEGGHRELPASTFRTGAPKFGVAKLTAAEARKLPLPDALFGPALKSDFGKPAITWVTEKLHEVKRARADYLAPRDLDSATETAKTLAEFLFAFGTAPKNGPTTGLARERERLADEFGRRVSFKELPALLPRALASFAAGYNQRQVDRNDRLFDLLSEATLNQLAREYFEAVVQKGVSWSDYLTSKGMTGQDATDIRKAIEPLLPRPTREEAAALYRQNLDGKLGAKDFYIATGLNPERLKALQSSDPKNFPRVDGRERDALAHLAARGPERDVDALERDFKQRVIHDGISVKAFLAEEGIKPDAWSTLRRNNPDLQARQRYGRAAIAAVGARATEIFAESPLMLLDELLAALNADRDLVNEHGTIEETRYREMRRESPELFPDLRNGWLDKGEAVVKDLLAKAKEHVPDSELVAAAAEKIPGFSVSNLKHLRSLNRVPNANAKQKRKPEEMAKVHEAIRKLLEKEPTLSSAEISRRLAAKGITLLVSDAGRVVAAVRPKSVAAGREFQSERNAEVMRELLQLEMRLHAPGTTTRELLNAWDADLVARGLPSMELEKQPNLESWASYFWAGPEASASARSAKVTAKVLHEYAAAADKGDTHEAIIERVLRDYPTLDLHRLSSYLKLWRAKPKEYPELARFLTQDGKLELEGLGRPVTPARFLGGFTFERGVMGGDEGEMLELARLSQSTRVPLRIPDLDAMVDDLRGRQPLARVHLLWVGHMLADSVAMSFALREAGLRPSRTQVVGSPYGTNDMVKATLERAGFAITKPALNVTAYKREVEAAFDRVVVQASGTDDPIIVLDDGGLTVEVLRQKLKEDPKKYGPIADRVRVVEQTTGGINLEEREQLPVPVIAVARSKSKQAEGEYIGDVIAAKIMQRLESAQGDLKGKNAVVGGFGFIGREIAEQLHARGAHVTIVEANPQVAKDIKAPFQLKSKADAIEHADLIVGATGNHDEPFMGVSDFRRMRDGAVFLSASSKRVEADMAGLADAADSRKALPPDNPLVTLPSARYQLGHKQIDVLGDGWPVNFDGGIQSVPPELIGLTDAALFAGVLQAARAGGRKGIEPLDADVDDAILARHKSFRKGVRRPAVYDPGEWKDDIRDLQKSRTTKT